MRFCFSTDDLLPGDRLQAWCDYLNERAYGYAPGGVPDDREFLARIEGLATGRFILMDIRANHTAARRTAAHVARDTSRAFAICRFNSATCWKAAPRSTPVDIQFAPGDWVVTSSEWEFDAIGMTTTNWDVLVIPHSVLSPLLTGGRLTRPFKLVADSPLGGLLSASLDAAKVQVPLLSPVVGDAVLRNLCELVVLACGAADERPSSGRDALRAEQLAIVKRHVEHHLADSDLTAASTAATLGISLRQLYVLFEPTGAGFARYVLRQRLLKCRDTIAGATGTGRSVADIAFGWGFSSLATFYRAYASEFGSTPAALRATQGGG
jgi:AraC-like DNA-binding protein